VLLLDEPEAHLDMARRERLGALLDDFDGAVVMISHDRHLLDATVSEIAELDRGDPDLAGQLQRLRVARQLELERRRQRTSPSRRRSRARGGRAALPHWAHIRVNERAPARRASSRCRSTAWRRSSGPVFERRRMALALRSGSRGGQRVLALEASTPATATSRSCSTSSSVVDARRARRRRRAQRRRQDDPAAGADEELRPWPARAGRATASPSATSRQAAASLRDDDTCSTRCARPLAEPRTRPCGC
jgi:ABC-type sulfate/molybdate transport systems ATPase subunit